HGRSRGHRAAAEPGGSIAPLLQRRHTGAAVAMVTTPRQTTPDEEAEPDSVCGSPLEIGVATRSESELPFVTAAAIAQMAPERVDWIVPGFVAGGVVLELDGKLKSSGKTTFAAELARAVV